MALMHNISTVAHYEAKTLRRSWFFRLFMIGSLLIFTFMNIGVFSPVGEEDWNLIAIPSSVPLVNLYLLNIGQAIVVIFLAADFLKRDKKVDTNEVLYTRSMSNFEYIAGKTWGIIRLFISLDLAILAIAMIINIISKSMNVDFPSYIAYLLILSLPTIVFSLGLAFMLMSLLKNQALTFLFLLGYAALNMFWLWFRAGSIFDYMAFGLPVYKSGIAGFDNLELIINQRLMYLFLGLALVMATILMFKRLPQSKGHTLLTIILLVIFSAGAGLCTINTLSLHTNSIKEKNLVIETNRQYEAEKFASLTEAKIDLRHHGSTIEATAAVKIVNDNNIPLEHYYFSLNPGLQVSSVSSGGSELQFVPTNHIVKVTPARSLKPGEADSMKIEYSGTINESFCYPNFSGSLKEDPYTAAMVRINKRQAFLTKEYVLLTPEVHWYPSFGLNYYPGNPARIKVDFTRYRLSVKTDENLVAVSQGLMEREGEKFFYSPESPLTGLTLAIGNYVADTLKAGDVNYISWHYPGNDYYKKDFTELSDTIRLLISGIMRELETNFSTKYPFRTLTLLEAPVQFYSYPRQSTQTRAELQPSMVILPEKFATLEGAGFARRITRQKKQMERNNQVITDKELKVRIFNSFIRNIFISGENFRFRNGVAFNEPTRFRLGPSFYFFRNNFYSDEFPVLNAAFESHLQKVSTPGRPAGPMGMFGNLSDNDRANLILREKSFRDLMAMSPGDDTVRIVLTVKGDYLFNLIRMNAGIEEFKNWFISYLDTNKFRRINISDFNSDIKKNFGFEFYPYLESWFNGVEQPGFLITNLQAREIIVGERSRYQVSFIASNSEKAGGLFNISFRTGGPGGGGMMMQRITVTQAGRGGGGGGQASVFAQGRGMEASDISKIVWLGAGESKKIGTVLDNQPRAMLVNTLFSKNLPGELTIPVNEVVRSKERSEGFEGEELLKAAPAFTEGNELVVDNEDQGFVRDTLRESNLLSRILGVKRERGELYGTVNLFGAPSFWQPVIQTNYYGKYIRSAVYTRSGPGDKSVEWKGIIDKPGYYDIFTYVGKAGNQMMFRGAGGGARGGGGQGPGGAPAGPMGQQQGENPFKDLHFRIYHDDGVEEITLDYETAEPGWNLLGRYYLSPDTVKVSLTNQSAGRVVIGDAVKWVIQE